MNEPTLFAIGAAPIEPAGFGMRELLAILFGNKRSTSLRGVLKGGFFFTAISWWSPLWLMIAGHEGEDNGWVDPFHWFHDKPEKAFGYIPGSNTPVSFRDYAAYWGPIESKQIDARLIPKLVVGVFLFSFTQPMWYRDP